MENEPRILIWDIETAQFLAAAFDLYQGIPKKNILKYGYIICGAWKWSGQRKVEAASVLDNTTLFSEDSGDDHEVVKTLYDKICEADAIVHHYGDKFDYRYVNSRLLYHVGKPLPPVIKIDTYKIAKQSFKLPSYSLDFIATYMGLESKASIDQSVWLRCMAGDKKAVREMVAYNKQDVQVLEKVFWRLLPFAPTKLNANLFGYDGCPVCGSENSQYRGSRYTTVGKYRRLQCNDCGKWYQEPDRINDKVRYK